VRGGPAGSDTPRGYHRRQEHERAETSQDRDALHLERAITGDKRSRPPCHRNGTLAAVASGTGLVSAPNP
jgi:hypothetical protein